MKLNNYIISNNEQLASSKIESLDWVRRRHVRDLETKSEKPKHHTAQALN